MTQDFIICGMDEAGRGPLAGPVVAAATILPKDFPVEILNDSKKLSAKKRAECEKIIKEKALWGIGIVNHTTIDKINILQASLLAMKLAFEQLLEKTQDKIDLDRIVGLADGTFCPDINAKCRCEIKADAKYPEVMAASIIAKEERDRIMIAYDKEYPEYGYAKHKGYPTKAHKEICHKIGPSPIQRLSFKY